MENLDHPVVLAMKVLIPVKRVIDYTVKIRVRPDKKGVDKKAIKMSMNPFCEIAVEEGVRMKEAQKASELVAVSIGPTKCAEQLRTAMAMGVDRAIHIRTADDVETDIALQPLAVSRILAAVVRREAPDLVLIGKQSIDDDSNQCAQMLAGRLGWAQATFASHIALDTPGKVTFLICIFDFRFLKCGAMTGGGAARGGRRRAEGVRDAARGDLCGSAAE